MADGETMSSTKKVILSLPLVQLTAADFLIALDQIITQIMENSNANAPVPATEDIMKNLPRTVLEEGCTTAPLIFETAC